MSSVIRYMTFLTYDMTGIDQFVPAMTPTPIQYRLVDSLRASEWAQVYGAFKTEDEAIDECNRRNELHHLSLYPESDSEVAEQSEVIAHPVWIHDDGTTDIFSSHSPSAALCKPIVSLGMDDIYRLSGTERPWSSANLSEKLMWHGMVAAMVRFDPLSKDFPNQEERALIHKRMLVGADDAIKSGSRKNGYCPIGVDRDARELISINIQPVLGDMNRQGWIVAMVSDESIQGVNRSDVIRSMADYGEEAISEVKHARMKLS